MDGRLSGPSTAAPTAAPVAPLPKRASGFRREAKSAVPVTPLPKRASGFRKEAKAAAPAKSAAPEKAAVPPQAAAAAPAPTGASLPALPKRAIRFQKGSKAAVPPSTEESRTKTGTVPSGETSTGAPSRRVEGSTRPEPAPATQETAPVKEVRVHWKDFFQNFLRVVIRPFADEVDMLALDVGPEEFRDLGEVAEWWYEAARQSFQESLDSFQRVFDYENRGMLTRADMSAVATEWELTRPWAVLDYGDEFLIPSVYHPSLQQKLEEAVRRMGL